MNKITFNQKLLFKIFFTILLATVLTLIIVGFLSFSFTVSVLKNSIEESELEQTHSMMGEIDRMLSERFNDIRGISGETEFQEDLLNFLKGVKTTDQNIKTKDCKRLKDLSSVTGPWNSLYIVDSKGTVILSTVEKEIGRPVGLWYYENLAYQKAVKGETNHSDFVVLKHTGQPTIVFATPIKDENDPLKPVIGVVLSDLSWGSVTQILHEIQDDHIFLFNHAGEIIGSNTEDVKTVLLDNSQGKSIIRELNKENSGSIVIPAKEGVFYEDTLVTAASQKGYSSYMGNGWTLAFTQPTHIAFASANKAASQIILILFPVIVLMGALILIAARRVIVHPITVLIKTIQSISIGDLTKQVPVVSHDEIGELGISFNEMTAKLKESYERQKDFTSTVSHELRTPLASIKMAIDLISQETVGPINSEQKDILGRAKEETDRLKRLINDILDLTKIEAGKLKMNFMVNDIHKVITQVVETQKEVAKDRGLFLKTEFDPKIQQVSFDRDRIVQVLNNLLSNAIKFTKHGGITVKTQDKSLENHILVSVIDTGKGIAQNDLPKLFQKFQQIESAQDNEEGGTGLGLAICREIVTRHGGKIWVESKTGEGTTFNFMLPIQNRRVIE